MSEFDINPFIDGDQDAFSVVYKMYYRRLCFFAQNIIDDPLEAEDIVTEAMVKLWRAHQNFTSLSKIRSFLYLSVKNAAINSLKARKRHTLSMNEIRFMSKEEEEWEEVEMLYAEVINDIYCEIESLPSKCRTIFKMIYFEGKSTSDIADELGIKSRTVLNQKTRALGILRLAMFKRNNPQDLFILGMLSMWACWLGMRFLLL